MVADPTLAVRRICAGIRDQGEARVFAQARNVLIASLRRVVEVAERYRRLCQRWREPDVITVEKYGRVTAGTLYILHRKQISAGAQSFAVQVGAPGRGLEKCRVDRAVATPGPVLNGPAQETRPYVTECLEKTIAVQRRRCLDDIVTQLLA